MRGKSPLFLLLNALLLTACGGGSGGSADVYTGPTELVAITSTADGDTAVAYVANEQLNPVHVSLDSGTVVFGFKVSGKPLTNLKKLGLDADAVGSTERFTGGYFAGATYTNTGSCSDGGTFSLTMNRAQGGTVTSGDSITIVNDHCRNGSSVTDGTIGATVTSSSGDVVSQTVPWAAEMVVGADAFSTSYSGELISYYLVLDGRLTFSASADGTGNELEVRGNSLAVQRSDKEHKLTDFSFYEAYDAGTGETTQRRDFTAASTTIGGRIVVKTTTDFKTSAGDSHPYEGVLEITGRNGAMVRLTAQSDASTVQLDYDYDGDGIWDNSQNKTWFELGFWDPLDPW